MLHRYQGPLEQIATCCIAAVLAASLQRALQEDAPLELHMWGTNLYTGELLTDLQASHAAGHFSMGSIPLPAVSWAYVCKLGLTKP